MKKYKKPLITGAISLLLLIAVGITLNSKQDLLSKYESSYLEVFTQFQSNDFNVEDISFLLGKEEANKVYSEYQSLQDRYFSNLDTLEAKYMSLVDIQSLQEEVNTFFNDTNALMTTKSEELFKASLTARNEVNVHESSNDAEQTKFKNTKATKTENFTELTINERIAVIRSLQSETASLHELYKTVQSRVDEEASVAYANAQAQANYNASASQGNTTGNSASNRSTNTNGGTANNTTPTPPSTGNDPHTPPCFWTTNPNMWDHAAGATVSESQGGSGPWWVCGVRF